MVAAKDGYVQQVTSATAVAGQALAVNYALRAFVPIVPDPLAAKGAFSSGCPGGAPAAFVAITFTNG